MSALPRLTAYTASEIRASHGNTPEPVDTPVAAPEEGADDVIDDTTGEAPPANPPTDDRPCPEACEDSKGEAGEAGGLGDNEGGDNGRSGRRLGRKLTDNSEKAPDPPIIPKVRRTNYEGFKNYYSVEESVFAIDVLEAGYNLKEEVYRERTKRNDRHRRPVPAITNMQRAGQMSDEVWIQRVRIKSPYILAHMRAVMSTTFKWDEPRTFFRPFHAFIHYQPKIKEVLKELQATVAEKLANPKSSAEEDAEKDKKFRRRRTMRNKRRSSVDGNKQGGAASDSSGSDSDSESDSGSESDDDAVDEAVPHELLVSQEAIDHLQCYVDFVDKNIMHLPDTYKGTSKTRIRYADLAYLFFPGDMVYSPTQAENVGMANLSAAKPSTAVYQPIWKIQYTNPPSISDTNSEEYDKNHRFYISCFYIDFDGKNYGPVKYRFDISPYEGEYEIKTLPLYPIRFHNTSANGLNTQSTDRLRPAGKDFQAFVEAKHLYYRGWTLTTSPNGDTLTDVAGELMKHPEHIDSSVIVDFKAALQALPSWKPTFKEPSRMDEEWTTSTDEKVPIKLWTDNKRTKLVRPIYEILQLRDGAHAVETNSYADKDTFLAAYIAGKTDTEYALSEEDLQLLPGRVMAYVLRDRKFVQLDVHYLSMIEQQSNVFDNLKIARQHKEMVMALVDSHFRRKSFKGPRHFSLGQDLIQGKGEGLVILLHGVPGVGKTATAEAVAQSNQQPLFAITCGDLGFTPKEVERSLEEIFRLAHLWNCILLLDEADIFLAERRRADLKRNALVSVFLRVLEYYSGILFLTTNRVGTLDEAFKSRIHMSLYYPPLNEKQTMQIFRMNIDRIKEIDQKRQELKKRDQDTANDRVSDDEDGYGIPSRFESDDKDDLSNHLIVNEDGVMEFAQDHFKKNKYGRWNGRQIRNAFQIASSLAFYDRRQAWIQQKTVDKTAKEGAAVLSYEQFKKVEDATLRFEQYMTEARGTDDPTLARLDRTRADDFTTDEQEEHWYKDRQVRLRRFHDDDYRGTSSRQQYGRPPSPPLQTPQSGRRGGNDYGRRHDDGRGMDHGYDTGTRLGGDRDRRYDLDRERDRERWGKERDWGRRDRDYNQGGSLHRYDRGHDQGWDRDQDRLDDRDDRDDRHYGHSRDDRGDRGPPSARSRPGAGGGNDFENGRDRTPTRSERPTSSSYDDTPSRSSGGVRESANDSSRGRGRTPDDDDYDNRLRYRGTSHHSPPPSTSGPQRVSYLD
ncbi:hypothetical protein SEUCBS139899_008932 [Sporothrix eucalyptigena]|uniref:AAA+ ATPase domain-containing protein n=1 Tax=Sporothrix eucalyptigena TaxID=1812306 RepID=A0ABP0CJY3_9PEZI